MRTTATKTRPAAPATHRHRWALTRDGGLSTEGEKLSRCQVCGCEKLSIAGAGKSNTGWITRYCFPSRTPLELLSRAPVCVPVSPVTIRPTDPPTDLSWRWWPR